MRSVHHATYIKNNIINQRVVDMCKHNLCIRKSLGCVTTRGSGGTYASCIRPAHIDTGTLLDFGKVLNLPEIDTYWYEREKGPAQTEALHLWIKNAIAQQLGPAILATHGLNIRDLLGGTVQQGDVLIVGIENNELVNLYQFSTPWEASVKE